MKNEFCEQMSNFKSNYHINVSYFFYRQQHATEHTERNFTTQTKDKRTNGKRNVLRREKDFENDALTSSIEDLEPGDNKEQSTKDKSDSCLNFQESHFFLINHA